MSLSKPQDENIARKALRQYMKLLQERPVLTKACTRYFIIFFGQMSSLYIFIVIFVAVYEVLKVIVFMIKINCIEFNKVNVCDFFLVIVVEQN